MKHSVLALLLILTGCTSGPSLYFDTQNETRILITVRADSGPSLSGSPARLLDYQRTYHSSVHAHRALKALTKEYPLTALEVWPINSLGIVCQVFAVHKSSASHLITQLELDSRVESVQVMNRFELLGDADPYRKLQNNLDQIKTAAAHDLATGAGVTIAIIDTHIDRGHPELKQIIKVQKNLTPQNRLTAHSHGTAIAGIIGAKENNGIGIAGIAPEADILALTACWSIEPNPASCNSFTLARALDYAVMNHAQIINLSLGGPMDALLDRLVKKALEQNIVVVGAYDPNRSHTFPASIEGVISVANNENIAKTVFAPGDEVLTTIPDAGYDFFSGHSFAAAHVTGIIALALELKPVLTPPEMALALRESISKDGIMNACTALIALDEQWACQ